MGVDNFGIAAWGLKNRFSGLDNRVSREADWTVFQDSTPRAQLAASTSPPALTVGDVARPFGPHPDLAASTSRIALASDPPNRVDESNQVRTAPTPNSTPPDFEAIAARINRTVEDNNAQGGVWGPAFIDFQAPVYNLNPAGDHSYLGLFGELKVLGRYGNWTGGGYGGGHLSPAFDFAKFDLTKADQRLLYAAELAKFTEGGEFWESPRVGYLDDYDRLARSHDLLYQGANLASAEAYRKAGEDFEAGRISAAQLEQALKDAEDSQELAFREADVWFMEYSRDIRPTDPYGIAIKTLGDAVFGLLTDAFYIQQIDSFPTHEVLRKVGAVYGSRLGQLIAGDNIFAERAGEQLGILIGRELADFFEGESGAGIGDSLLAVVNGELPISKLLNDALEEAGGALGDLALEELTKLANALLADAAKALGLSGIGEYVFIETGQAIGDYLFELLSSGEIDGIGEFFDAISTDLDFSSIGNFLIDVAIEILGDQVNDFIGSILEDARGLVEIDSSAEGYLAELGSLIGSVIGSIELPFLGGEIGATIGHILGSIVFEVLDFISFGLLGDIIDFFSGGDPHPESWIYVGVDPATNHLEIIGQDWKKDGIDTADILRIHNGNLQLNAAFRTYVNEVIDSIGATVDDSFFYPITPNLGVIDPTVDFRNHAMIGFRTDNFFVRAYWGGNEARAVTSTDPQAIISHAVAYELAHLIFYGGDLTQTRALNLWELALNAQLPAHLQASYFTTGILAAKPDNPMLDVLGANLQIATQYRFYLDNQEAINHLMTQGPNSAFTLGWIATLARAAELGLHLPYVGNTDGGIGTATAETILAADGNDQLLGEGGDDVIKAYGGNDAVYGGDGNDEISGGRGRDLLLGDRGDDRIDGDDGADRLFGYEGDDILSGGADKDEMAGEAGDDRLDGGAGDDVLYGDIPGAAGADRLIGGDGDDLARGGAGADTIDGGVGEDRLYGDEGDDAVAGGVGNDRLYGGVGVDLIDGGAGSDRILGDAGADRLAGGEGDDLLYGLGDNDLSEGGAGVDSLYGDAGDDNLRGGDDNDRIGGWTGADVLSGDEGGDLIAGEDGNDYLAGGTGNDTLYGDRQPEMHQPAHTESEIIARTRVRIGAGDFAILYQGPSYTKAGLLASDHDMIIINPAETVVTGQVNSEVLWGRADIDAIEAGGKLLLGYLNVAKINDFTDYWNPGWTVDGHAGSALSATAPDFLSDSDSGFNHSRLVDFWHAEWRDLLIERVEAIVAQGFSGLFLDDVLEYFTRRGGSDAGIAQAAREMRDLVIDIAAAARALVAQRDGSAAAEDFVIVVNGAPFLVQDTTADLSAHDTAREAAFYASIDAFLAENYFSQGLDYAVDQAVAQYGSRGIALLSVDTDIVTDQQRIEMEKAAIDAGFLPEVVPEFDYGTDTARFVPGYGDVPAPGDDILDGGPGDDLLFGGAGSDTASFASHLSGPVVVDLRIAGPQDSGAGLDTLIDIENLIGSSLDDQLTGNSFANQLDGGGGNDIMFGREGHDVYIVDNVGDQPTEYAGQGIDTIYSPLSYTLNDVSEVENLSTLSWESTDAINLTGNGLANTLIGNAGSNLLNGASGGDVMIGREGNDTYLVDSATDQAVETPGEGADIIYSAINYILTDASEVEGLSTLSWEATTAINLVGNYLNNTLIGNAGANQLNGAIGADVLIGREGNDSYMIDNEGDLIVESVGQGADSLFSATSYRLAPGADVEILSTIIWEATTAINLTGNGLANTLIGNAGANVLDGGGGSDVMIGRDGNDIYIFDTTADIATESAGEGIDIIYSAVSYTLAANSQIENLSTLSWQATDPLSLTGNGLANTLIGNAGANQLDGGAGNDVMIGREGNDIYLVDGLGDQIVEAAGQGYDVIYTSGHHVLAADAEVEGLSTINWQATTTLNLGGNALGNYLIGNAGANALDGKGGSDILHGREGADRFGFTTALGANNIDQILDFEVAVDKIALDDAIFSTLPLGALASGAFVIGTAAQDINDRIVYNNMTGQLFYDADGSGPGAAIQFATLQTGLALTAGDFQVL